MGKYVLVKGVAGLGNRLITIASAIEYAQTNDRKIIVDWTDGFFAPKGVNAFEILFQSELVSTKIPDDFHNMSFYPECAKKLPEQYEIYDYFSIVQPSNRYIRKTLSLFNRITRIRVRQHWETKRLEIFKERECFEFGGELPRGLQEEVVLFADYIPMYSKEILRNCIKTSDSIETDINKFIQDNKLEKGVGVHIRATDKKSHKNCLVFIKRLQKFVSKNEIQKIYLATDNPDIEAKFREVFVDRLCTWPKFLPKVESGGIHHWAKECGEDDTIVRMARESVIDMFMLSKMEYLFYQKGSTFSEISSVFHHNQDKCWNWQTFM